MAEGQHYFSPTPVSAHDPGEVELRVGERRLTLATDAGVFSKGKVDRGTRLLLEAVEKARIPLPERGNVCDLGCGYGPIGLAVAALRPASTVYMVDINERAADLARRNAKANDLHNVVVAQGSGVEPFGGIVFDAVLTNPPLRTGKENVHALLKQGFNALKPGGCLALVIRTQQGAKSMERYMAETFGNVSEVEKGGGFRVYTTIRA